MTRLEFAAARTAADLLDARDPSSKTRASLRAWLSFQATLGLKLALAHRSLADHGGDPQRALVASGAAPKWSARRLDKALETLASVDAMGLPLSADSYPRRLRRLSDAPPLLWVRGSVADLSRRSVAIVGARAATPYGLDIARRLAGELARAGVVVVSGLARGIDGAAHEGALEAGGRTVAVQACGPELVYPASHTRLAERIRASGAVVTELPPGMRPRAPFFPLRNRMISALAELVVVVEARPRSGSLITARHALDQGGEVMAVPGPIQAPTSQGTNALLRDGARPVAELRDVLDAIGVTAVASAASAAPLDAGARGLLETLRERPRSRDELAREGTRSDGELDLQLLELQLEGLAAEGRDGRWEAIGPSGE